MRKTIQARHHPSDWKRDLRSRAALKGMSVSVYLLREASHTVGRPTLDEMRKRLERRRPVQLRQSVAAAVRAERHKR